MVAANMTYSIANSMASSTDLSLPIIIILFLGIVGCIVFDSWWDNASKAAKKIVKVKLTPY